MSADWSFALPDWEARLAEGRSLLPDLPLDAAEAGRAVAIFNKLRLPDVPGQPAMGQAAAEWQRDVVRAIFGSIEDGRRRVAEILAMVPKKSNKTTMGAAITIVALLMNERPRAEMVYIGPTQEIADTAFSQAVGMIEADEYLAKRFHVQHNTKTITDRRNKTKAKIKTFDMKVVTGSKPVFVLLDELHLMAAIGGAGRIIGQIRGGMLPNPEAAMVMITTQSDVPPAGVFKEELTYARAVRDGKAPSGRLLPLLYEFPEAMQRDESWREPKFWHMVSPSLNRPVTLDALIEAYGEARQKGDAEERRWVSQHLNVEMGIALYSDRWRAADFWENAGDDRLADLDELLARSEVVTFGGDGGGLDDLLGAAVIGREKGTRHWLAWTHAWAHRQVLKARPEIAPVLTDFAEEGSLTLCDKAADLATGFGDAFARVLASGLLPEKDAVALDPNNVAALIEELTKRGMTDKMLRRLLQGPALAPAWWGIEMKLADGTFFHSATRMMAWCVGNAKIEPRGNAVMVTKQISGRAKIDPVIAMGEAAILMSWNPAAKGPSVYRTRGALVL